MLLLYTADERNMHQVEPVTAGERATLTMWFTLEQEHQEDKKVRCAGAMNVTLSFAHAHCFVRRVLCQLHVRIASMICTLR
jgi:hypothetical protein